MLDREWWIYYGNGAIFSHKDGTPFCVPRTNVQVIVQTNAESPSGYCITLGRRWYYWNDGWWPDDELAEWLDECPSGCLQILRGRSCLNFESIKMRAVEFKRELIRSAL